LNTQYADTKKPGNILVADDDPSTCKFLKSLLESQSHSVTITHEGKSALENAKRNLPDVLLLDLRMPEVDGITVCRTLKEDPNTAAIQIIVITGYDDRETRLDGIKAGADDFLVKPIDSDEVLLRVKNAINTRRLYDKIKEDFVQLEKLEQMQKRLMHMILHDMRTPLMSLITGLELLASIDMKYNKEKALDALDAARAASRELIELANSIIDVSRLQADRMPLSIRACGITEVIKDAIHILKPMFGTAKIVLREPDQQTTVWCDSDIIRRVMVNLLSNALKATSFRGVIEIAVSKNEENVSISVHDEGIPIPKEYHEKIFEQFGEVEIGRRLSSSVGLGLPFCKMATEAHGGKIYIESGKTEGNTFIVTLPVHGPIHSSNAS